jgi:hypothetical protein
MDEKQIERGLVGLLAELDQAIVQAVENPLLFVDHPLLAVIDRRCSALLGSGLKTTAPQLQLLAWQVRARAGRLQLLLNSAAHFYTTCFSVSQCEGLAYGMQGEWGAVENPNHLTVDC